jgi:hypothetical protein
VNTTCLSSFLLIPPSISSNPSSPKGKFLTINVGRQAPVYFQ